MYDWKIVIPTCSGSEINDFIIIIIIIIIIITRKCPLRGHCLAPPGGLSGRKLGRWFQIFLMHIFHS